jgi:hypothetical protein
MIMTSPRDVGPYDFDDYDDDNGNVYDVTHGDDDDDE